MYRSNDESLGLGEDFKFGIEFEVFNVNTSSNIRNISRNFVEKIKGKFTGNVREHKSLYHSKESKKFFEKILSSDGKPYKMASAHEEALVKKGGAEIVSPILRDNKHDWQTVFSVLNHIKKFPGTKGKEAVADEKCGLHIHFDSKLLTENPKIMRNFMELWPDMEELVYKMCNDKNDPIRQSTIIRSKNPLREFKRMAGPIGKKLQKQINEGKLKISPKKYGKFRSVVDKFKLDRKRYNGLNLTNIGNPNKNTIEFRMANGTLNPEVVKQNVYLYASIIKLSRNLVQKERYKTEELKQFRRTDITEDEKAKAFVDLLFDNEEDKKIFMDRYKSVKDAKIFRNADRKGFASNKFQRDSMKKISERTNLKDVREALNFIFRSRTNERGEANYER